MKVNGEAISKLIQAKQLQKEALLSVLPDSVSGHLSVISKEITGLMIDIVEEIVEANDKGIVTETINSYKEAVNESKDSKTKTSKVKKVDIN